MANDVATWKFYRWSKDAWEGMLDALEGAERTIDFEQYYFVDLSEGLIGHRFAEVLGRKAKSGVRVRLLLDATGSWEFYRSALVGELEEQGVQVRFHETIPLRHAGHFFQSFLRDHRRLIVVDGKIGLVGGTAIKESAEDWRDTHVRLEGPVVDNLQRSFDVLWRGIVQVDRFKIEKPMASADKFTVVANGLLPGQRHIRRSILEAVQASKKSIYISSPYFNPDHGTFRALRLAAKRGVDVRVLLPAQCDFRVAQYVAESFYDGALRSGIRLFGYTPSFFHAKSIIVDDDWATFGSCNFDRLSYYFNYELNVISYDPKFVLEAKNHFFDDLQSSLEITKAEWRKRWFWQKILEKLSFFMRPVV